MPPQTDQSAWEYVYDKYAPIMYGIALDMAGDTIIATEILKEAFLELKKKKSLSRIHAGLHHSLVRHTYKLTLKHLKSRGLLPAKIQPFNQIYPLINVFYFEAIGLKEVAVKFDTTEEETRKNLRAEFNHLRMQHRLKDMPAAITRIFNDE